MQIIEVGGVCLGMRNFGIVYVNMACEKGIYFLDFVTGASWKIAFTVQTPF